MAKFTPSSPLYNSDPDGAWEFPETMAKSRTAGELIEFLKMEEKTGLNNSENPHYLVQNKFEWSFEVDDKPLWLKMTWQPWSSETERGFDDPYLVVYLNQEVIFKEGIDNCCQPQTKQWYLGELSGEQTIYIYAGEMGDLEKPSGVEIESLKLLTEREEIAPIETVTPTPTPVIISQVAVQPSIVPIESTVIDDTPLSSGAVLGVKEESVEEGVENVPNWRESLENIVFHPWFFWLTWASLFLLLAVVTFIVSKYFYSKSRKERV